MQHFGLDGLQSSVVRLDAACRHLLKHRRHGLLNGGIDFVAKLFKQDVLRHVGVRRGAYAPILAALREKKIHEAGDRRVHLVGSEAVEHLRALAVLEFLGDMGGVDALVLAQVIQPAQLVQAAGVDGAFQFAAELNAKDAAIHRRAGFPTVRRQSSVNVFRQRHRHYPMPSMSCLNRHCAAWALRSSGVMLS